MENIFKGIFTSAMFSAKTPADLLQPGRVGLEVDALGPDVPGPGQTRGGPEAEQSAVMLTHHVVLTVRRGEAILDVLLEVRAPACEVPGYTL